MILPSRSQLRKIGAIIVMLMVSQWSLFPSSLAAIGPNQTLFQQRTQDFFNHLDRTIGNDRARNSIEQSTNGHLSLLTAFLDDLINTMAAFEHQDVLKPDLTPASELVERWRHLGDSCESCGAIIAVIQRILDHLSTQMSAQGNGSSPFSTLYGFYQNIAQQDLGGFESLFQLVWPEPRMKRTQVYEKKLIRGTGKEEGTFVIDRRVVQKVDGRVVFAEWIGDNQLMAFDCAPQETSFLHQALREMRQDAADPDAIRLVESLVGLLDQEVVAAHNTGNLNDFAYQFLYDPDFQSRQIALSRHPLMKPPYSADQFQILKYYQNEPGNNEEFLKNLRKEFLDTPTK